MLPNILDIATDHQLTFQPRSFGKKQTLAKCPFCREDDQPRKRKKYYLSLNTQEQLFRCWFCGESGGVFRFIALLEGVSEKEVIDRYRKKSGSTYKQHPAEKLTSSQCKMMGLDAKPDWVDIRKFDYESYKELRELVWKAWKQFLWNEKRFAYQLLVAGVAGGTYGNVVEAIQEREKAIGSPLLAEVLDIYSLPERPAQINRLEALTLHMCDPLKYPYSPMEKQ
ncbi:hypothetical protein [Domibacillus robiginosus]|uniref:hypothetical protein n=1 Tax=Domibacillus robiginosus TaxID=1071054 RepID=UPI00067C36FC|nr:hypothetical protein [Domibacillus robiginosus]